MSSQISRAVPSLATPQPTSSTREAIARARVYLCTDSRSRQGDLEQFLDAVLAAGVDVVQLREKGLEAARELELLAVFAAAAARHNRLFAVNDRADLAAVSHCRVLHLGQRDLTPAQARPMIGAEAVIGRSSHSPDQFDAAQADPAIDYVCAGPVWATPTKPGRPATGLDLIRHAARSPARPKPWFAIGGVDLSTIEQVVEAGARRVVVVRVITEADDPAEVVLRLRQALPDSGPEA